MGGQRGKDIGDHWGAIEALKPGAGCFVQRTAGRDTQRLLQGQDRSMRPGFKASIAPQSLPMSLPRWPPIAWPLARYQVGLWRSCARQPCVTPPA